MEDIVIALVSHPLGILILVILLILLLITYFVLRSMTTTTPPRSAQTASLSNRFGGGSTATSTGTKKEGFVNLNTVVSNPTAKRPVTELLATGDMPESQQCLVNFYTLGTRFTGYLGPMVNGYFDPDTAVQFAVQAGCRAFVLEIDYIDECKGETIQYYPRIVVRDAQGKLLINPETSKPLCNSPTHSTIRDVCEKINFYAFSSSTQNATDPVIIVLYFLRQPPGSYQSKAVLDYYSNVAKSLSPFQNRLISNELDGGTFYRQKQEGRLLMNKITDYNNKVLIFSNANTIGFREVTTYSPNEDLDFLTNLRLSYTQTKLGVTENETGEIYGILQTTEDYLQIPPDRSEETIDQTKLRWTICLSRDPTKPVTKEIYDKITNTYGVHCIPIQLFDEQNTFMFTDKTFKTYSFQPKPEPLRYIKPPIIIPGKPNKKMDAKQGNLRNPTL